jgi:peptide/nickel transport system substrate-binding protein
MPTLSRRPSTLAVVGLIAALLASCTSQTVAPSSTEGSPASVRSVPGKPLHIGLIKEPSELGSKFGGGATGNSDYPFLFHAKVTHYDQLGNPMPVLVEEVPSFERGTWKVYDDGRMDTTFRLRNTTWHDGTPLTTDDIVFTFDAIMNPQLPAENREPEKSIESIERLDARTFVVHWRETNILANAWDLEPLPKHILDPLIQRDVQSFSNAGFWTREWVGLGPYRVADWITGTYIRGQAFAGFALGEPRIQEIFIHFVGDANNAVAQMLAGAVDVTLGNLLRVEEGMTVKEQMEPRGEGSVMTIPTKIRYGELQYRDPLPPPSRDVRVRQAMVHALDRQILADTLLFGLSSPADVYLAPTDAAYSAASEAIRKYPFDPSRAGVLLQEADWTKGADGVLRSSAGERFDLEVRTTAETQNQKEVQILSDAWKQAGVNTSIEIVPIAKQNDQEYRAKFPGISTSSTSISIDWMDKWQTDRAASEANRWRGGNRGAYSNATVDRMYRDYITTIDPTKRQDALVQLVKFASEDVTYVPLFYQVDVHAIRTGLNGLVPRWPGQSGMAFNSYEWYWE